MFFAYYLIVELYVYALILVPSHNRKTMLVELLQSVELLLRKLYYLSLLLCGVSLCWQISDKDDMVAYAWHYLYAMVLQHIDLDYLVTP